MGRGADNGKSGCSYRKQGDVVVYNGPEGKGGVEAGEENPGGCRAQPAFGSVGLSPAVLHDIRVANTGATDGPYQYTGNVIRYVFVGAAVRATGEGGDTRGKLEERGRRRACGGAEQGVPFVVV